MSVPPSSPDFSSLVPLKVDFFHRPNACLRPQLSRFGKMKLSFPAPPLSCIRKVRNFADMNGKLLRKAFSTRRTAPFFVSPNLFIRLDFFTSFPSPGLKLLPFFFRENFFFDLQVGASETLP